MIGVIIPAYNRKDCLRACLKSLTLQTKKSFYTIIVDDCSSELLRNVVDEFKWQLHIKYIRLNENGGPGVARQAGLEYCYDKKIDYVIFLDSDDQLFPYAIERLNYMMHHTGSDIVSSNIWSEHSNGTGAPIPAKNTTFVHGKIYSTNFLKQNNITFPPLRTNEDLAFNLKAIELTDKHFILDETLHMFHDNDSSITRCGSNNIALQLNYVLAIYDAAMFLKQKEKITPHMIMNIFNCYNASQRGILLGGELTDTIQESTRQLLALPEIRDALKTKKYLDKLAEKIQQMEVINGELQSFPQTFTDWIKEYTQ